MDCFDACVWQVEVKEGRVTRVTGDPDHPYTQGKVCPKAERQVERMYSPDRVRYPLRKTPSGWRKISWDDALAEISEKLGQIAAESGTTAVLHNFDSGSNGLLNSLDQRFFNAFGGVTRTYGSLCWGAGDAAQKTDFGECRAHRWEDVLNSELVVLWGRNVSETNRHLLPFLKKVKERGGRIIVVNPVNIKLPFDADLFVPVKPGTDGALALALGHVICRERWLDLSFVSRYVSGFQEYLRVVKQYPPEKAAAITGVSKEMIEKFAARYARAGAASIFLGYGMQRYTNGGRTVRAIDALAAITGNVGKSGGGVNYSFAGYKKKIFVDISGKELAGARRKIPYPCWGEAVLALTDPPVRAIFVTRSNPVCQLPNTTKVLEAFRRAEFVVTVDFTLTDTAVESDLVLPCATVFEAENIVANSMNQHFGYVPKLVDPQGESRPDAWIFMHLAKTMGLEEIFGELNTDQWMERILEPLNKYGIDLAELKKHGVMDNPLIKPVAWEDRKFATPSGKIELYSPSLAAKGMGTADYVPSTETGGKKGTDGQYSLVLLTPHSSNRIHSQFHDLQLDKAMYMPVLLHPQTAIDHGIADGGLVLVESARGQVKGVARLTANVLPGVLVIESGWWIKFGGGVNALTPGRVSDIGNTAVYYDCRCSIRRITEV